MSDIQVTRLELTQEREEYRLRFATNDGFEAEMRADNRLGCIMSAWSVALKSLAVSKGLPVPTTETRLMTGTIQLSRYTITPVSVWPYAYRLVMAGHGYSYTCNMDRDLEHVLLAYSGAMKFFATKLGLTVLHDEVIRNADAEQERALPKRKRR